MANYQNVSMINAKIYNLSDLFFFYSIVSGVFCLSSAYFLVKRQNNTLTHNPNKLIIIYNIYKQAYHEEKEKTQAAKSEVTLKISKTIALVIEDRPEILFFVFL